MNRKEVLERYPFLRFKDSDFTHLDFIPCGWKNLCLELCEEIRTELLKHEGALENYQILQLKEKYGWLRWYDNNDSDDINLWPIIHRFEKLSTRTCVICGRTTMNSSSRGVPMCGECGERNE